MLRKLSPPLRPLLFGLGILLLLLVVCEGIGWPFLRAPLEQQISARLNREVKLEGAFRLRLLGAIRLQVQELRIAGPDWDIRASRQPYFIRAQDARLVLPYRSLLGRASAATMDKPLLVRRLEVGAITARLVRTEDGRSNWRFDLPERDADAPQQRSVAPEFEHFVVRQGRLDLADAKAGLRLAAQVRTEEGSAGRNAGLHVSAEGRYRDLPFTATAQSSGLLPLVAPRGSTGPVALSFTARLTDPRRSDSKLRFDGTARDLLRFEGLQGKFHLSGPSLAAVGEPLGVTLPTTAPFTMGGQVGKQGTVWQVDVATFDVARTQLEGRFRYDSGLSPPRLTGQLRGRQLVLEDLAPAVGASPELASSSRDAPDKPAAARVLPEREFDIPSLHRMDAAVDIRLARVDLGSERLKPLEPLEGRLTLERGVLRLDRLLARTADGELQGSIELDGRPDVPKWRTDLRWSGIRLAQWLTARNRFADEAERTPVGQSGKTVAPPFITGELAGQARLSGKGRSTARMLATADGSLQLWVRKGELSQLLVEAVGLDVAQGLGLIITGDRNIPMHCAALSMKARDGMLATEAGIIDTPDSMILVRGTISLAEERLDLTLEARPHDRSPLSVRAPILVRGRLADPEIRPDPAKVGAKAALATLLGALAAPFAALLPLVDPGAGTAGQGCAQTLARLKKNPDTPAAMKRAVGGQRK